MAESDRNKKIGIIALIIALLAIAGGSTTTTIYNNGSYQPELNNTNLAPTFPGEPIGTGERVTNVTYYANSTPIEVHAFSHASTSGQNARVFLYINNTLVSPRSGRPIAVAEEVYSGVDVTIPQGAYYRLNFSNYHHYEWREYRILSGNATTGTTNVTINQSALNEKVNKTGDMMTGNLNMTGNTILNPSTIQSNLGQLMIVDDIGANSMIYLQTPNSSIIMNNNETKLNKQINFTTNNQTIKFQSDFSSTLQVVVVNETVAGAQLTQDTSGVIRWSNFNISVPVTINILALNVTSFGGGGAFRLALYDDSGFSPNNLLVETGSTAPSNGWNNVTVANQNLGVGTYWVAMQTNSITTTYYSGVAAGQARFRVQGYGAFPNPAGSSSDSNGFNMRVGYTNTVPGVAKYFCLHATYQGSIYLVEC